MQEKKQLISRLREAETRILSVENDVDAKDAVGRNKREVDELREECLRLQRKCNNLQIQLDEATSRIENNNNNNVVNNATKGLNNVYYSPYKGANNNNNEQPWSRLLEEHQALQAQVNPYTHSLTPHTYSISHTTQIARTRARTRKHTHSSRVSSAQFCTQNNNLLMTSSNDGGLAV